MITIINYGMGNLRSIQKAIEYIGGQARITSKPYDIMTAAAVVLPGVGAFGLAMRNLKKNGLINPIKDHIKKEKVFLGICLGYQLLFESSTENGLHKGLGILKGNVRRFPFQGTSTMPVPHMGWNRLFVPHPNSVFNKQCHNAYFYFVHSYYPDSYDVSSVCAFAEYGIRFQACVQKNTVFGCQFHPEKSGEAGLNIIRRFVKYS